MASTASLTAHLTSLHLNSTPYSSATEHPFLTAAGNGTLPDALLALWLSQDRIYAAHAYPQFIGHLISKIPFSSSHTLDSIEERKNQQILELLVFSLENIVKEASFFRDVSKKWGLDLECWKERKATRDYTAEMARIANSGTLEDGVVFLWAMEQVSFIRTVQSQPELTLSKVYFDAWKYVASLQRKNGSSTIDPSANAVSTFTSNWTSPEFYKFVEDLAATVNGFDIPPDSVAWKKAKEIWVRIIELEEAFWPTDGEEKCTCAVV